MTIDYRFPTRIKKIEEVQGPRVHMEPPPDDEERGEIMGRYAVSFAEWVFALALWYLKLRFVYRWPIPRTRFHVDFYVQSAPQWALVDVRQFRQGQEAGSQRFRRAIIERKMGRPLHTVWDTELSTFEEGVNMVRKLTR